MSETKPDPALTPAAPSLPWPFKAAAVFGVAVPIGMLAHLGHRDQQELGRQVETLDVQRSALTVERDALAGEVAGFDGVRDQLVQASEELVVERKRVEVLEGEVSGLNQKVAVLGEREESLRDIIDLLEGEVVSAEKKLAKIREEKPALVTGLRHLTASAIVASNDPHLRRENDRLRNELRKHDEQVVELLGEISVLNQEIEVIREQSGKYPAAQVNNDPGLNGAALAGLSDED